MVPAAPPPHPGPLPLEGERETRFQQIQPPPPAVAALLEERRQSLNARFRAARGLTPRLDGDAVLTHLGTTIAPIVQAVAEARPERAGPVLDRLYDLSLDLLGRSVIGPESRHPAIDEGWRRLLGGLPGLTAAEPEAMARIVTNALFTLSTEPAARPRQWIDLMAEVGPLCPNPKRFAKCGTVAAWRAGMAHYRDGALAVCARLEAESAARLLGLADAATVPTALAALRDDPWLPPGEAGPPAPSVLTLVGTVGGFVGFGGPFLAPPRVAWHDGAMVATDERTAFSIHADACGRVLLRTGLPPLDGPLPSGIDFGLSRAGRVTRGRLSAQFPDLAGASAWISDGATLAATLADSHLVFLVAAVRRSEG
ncbi:MAG: hypothetical protein H7840_04125 [Alphaproteobacteria bacterium]